MLCVLSGAPSAAGFMFRTSLATLVPAMLPEPCIYGYRLQACVVSDKLVSRNACVMAISGPFWQCYGKDFALDLIPSPNPCASLRFKGPNPNLHSPVQPPSQETRFREKPTLATGASQEAIFREKRTLATCLSQEEIFQDKPTLAAALFSFMLPHAAELPHSENPSSATPSLNALEGCPLTSWAAPSEVPEVSAATPEYGCKVRAPTCALGPTTRVSMSLETGAEGGAVATTHRSQNLKVLSLKFFQNVISFSDRFECLAFSVICLACAVQ